MQGLNPEAHRQNDQGFVPERDACTQPQQYVAGAIAGSGDHPTLVYKIQIADMPPEGISLGIGTGDVSHGGQGIMVKLGLNTESQPVENQWGGYSSPAQLPSATDWVYAGSACAYNRVVDYMSAGCAGTSAGFVSDVFTDEVDEAGLDACFSSQLSEDSVPIARFAPQGHGGMFAEDEHAETCFAEAGIAAGILAMDPVVKPAVQPEAGQPQSQQDSQPENISQENLHEPQAAEPKKTKIGDVIFYLFLIALVVGAFVLFGGSGNGPRMIAGYSAFTVTTGSMHDVLPQGSLIVTKQVDPETLQVGDDITYMTSETSSITHRIVGIEEEYEATGERAFKTKGTMNKNPDAKMVPAVNVVGKVVFCSPALGTAVGFIRHNWPLLIFLAMIAGGLTIALKRILR